MQFKICLVCGERKPLTAAFFCRDTAIKCGFSGRCKACRKKTRKTYATETTKLWKLANPERVRECKKRWHQSPKGRQSARELKRRLCQNPIYRVRNSISRRMRASLKGAKSAGWQILVGYTVNDLRAHLERQFTKGISWNNYGTAWDVDHIIPVRLFKLPEEVRACWALTNLRPLAKRANNEKGGHRLHLL